MISSSKETNKPKTTAESIANTFEWLITAFILAFVFRAFVMEAFRIPTGSMAETLRGAHWQLACTQCGYKFDYNYGLEMGPVRNGHAVLPEPAKCSSCGYYNNMGQSLPVSNGDRILVLKCIYQLFEPKRWDVVVFKNPTFPRENYIKRLIGKPGEKVEIIDGDIYINDKIARKPEKVQKELWMTVYNNDYTPANPTVGSFNGHHWTMPFENDRYTNSNWNLFDPNKPTVFTLDSEPDKEHTIFYSTDKNPSANDFKADYAYNRPSQQRRMPQASDLMVNFYVTQATEESSVSIKLRKYDTVYTATIEFAKSQLILTKKSDRANPITIETMPIQNAYTELFQFSNVDHTLTAKYGDNELTFDLGASKDALGSRIHTDKPKVAIIGSGKITLNHIKVFRDTHYIDDSPRILRAKEGKPLQLGEDEFFVLGDNSPNSSDGRYWEMPGIGNATKRYREGIVPRDYMVGKAFFVYWPGGFRIAPNSNLPLPFLKWPIVPNVGQMKFIHGG